LKKETTIKDEFEKFLYDGFIYPIPLIEWVSNPILVAKKQGTIRGCINFRAINKYFPKYNYPTPFVDHIINECIKSEIFSFMDGFFGYN